MSCAANWKVDQDGVECYDADGPTTCSGDYSVEQDNNNTKTNSTQDAPVDTESWLGKLFAGATDEPRCKTEKPSKAQQRKRANQKSAKPMASGVVPPTSPPPTTKQKRHSKRKSDFSSKKADRKQQGSSSTGFSFGRMFKNAFGIGSSTKA